MSAGPVGWVYKHSPYKGVKFNIHLAIADVVSDLYDYEFWMALGKLADKARTSRPSASEAVAELVKDGFIAQLEAPRFGGSQRAMPGRYRFLMPDCAVVFEPRFSGVVSADTEKIPVSSPAVPVSSQPIYGVVSHDTNPREPNANKTASREEIERSDFVRRGPVSPKLPKDDALSEIERIRQETLGGRRGPKSKIPVPLKNPVEDVPVDSEVF